MAQIDGPDSTLPLWALAERQREEQRQEPTHGTDPTPPLESISRTSPVAERLEQVVSIKEFEHALRYQSGHSVLRFTFDADYSEQLLQPLRELAKRARSTPRMHAPADVVEDSRKHEEKAHRNLTVLAERLGPVAVLDKLTTMRNQFRKEPGNHYLERMFGSSHPERNIVRAINACFFKGTDLSIGSLERKEIPEKASRGLLSTVSHPKEIILEAITRQSPLLAEGGRILVICDHPTTAKYLASQMASWERVSSVERTLKAGIPGRLADKSSASQSEDQSIEAVVLTRAQLKNGFGKEGMIATHAAVTVLYDIEINQHTGKIKDPAKIDMPQLFSPSFIELARTTQSLQNISQSLHLGDPKELEDD